MRAFQTWLIAALGCVVADDPSSHLIPTYGEDLLASYSADQQALLPGYSERQEDNVMSGIDMLRMSVPGNPGQDYPIFSSVPDTSFSCEGRVEGGYYADTEADCQPFHVCTADSGSNDLVKFSFLCPNGTLFNQEHFVCEYWFNVDCAASESFYGLNENIGEVPAEGGYNTPSVAASSPVGYAAPSSNNYQVPEPSDQTYSAPDPSDQSDSAPDPSDLTYSAPEPSDQTYSAPDPSDLTYSAPDPSDLTYSAPDPSDQTYSAPDPSDQTYSAPEAVSEYKAGLRSGRRGGRVLSGRQGGRRGKSRTGERRGGRTGERLKSIKQKVPTLPVVSRNRKKTARTLKNSRLSSRPSGRGGKTPVSDFGRTGRQEPLTGYLPPLEEEEEEEEEESQYDYEYQEAPLPTYNSAAASASSSYAAGAADIASSVTELADEVYQEDELPTYNSGVYSEGNTDSASRYTAPVVDSIPADSGLEEGDVLPAYNNGVYNGAQAQTEVVEYEYEDELPTYNNGVYSQGDVSGIRYTAPATLDGASDSGSYEAPDQESYGAPADPESYEAPAFSPSAPSGSSFQPISAPADSYGGPSTTIYEAPVAGSYLDPSADILPEYHKSEISLGLNNRNEVPRITPFQTDFGEPLYIGTYKASGSAPSPAVVKPPTSRADYLPPTGPVLSNYNIPDISDAGFKGLGSSYGRK